MVSSNAFKSRSYSNIFLQSKEQNYHDDYDILTTIFNQDGSLGKKDYINRELHFHKKETLRKEDAHISEAFLLLGEWERNIHHYLSEYLSAVEVYFEMVKENPNLLVVMKDFRRNRFIAKALGLYEKTIFVKNDTYRIDRAWTANAPNILNLGITENSIFHKIAKYTLDNVEHEPIEKMWISRRNLQSKKRFHNRRILNIDEMADLILSKGFTEYFADGEEFEVSLAKIISAKRVVTEIGAACDNVLFRSYSEGFFDIFYPKEVESWSKYFTTYSSQVKSKVRIFECGTQTIDPAFVGVNERNHPWTINLNKLKLILST